MITNLLASSPLRLNNLPRDPVFMFRISELSDLIAAVKRRIASVGLNTSDCLLFLKMLQATTPNFYLANNLSFSFRSMLKSSPVGLKVAVI